MGAKVTTGSSSRPKISHSARSWAAMVTVVLTSVRSASRSNSRNRRSVTSTSCGAASKTSEAAVSAMA